MVVAGIALVVAIAGTALAGQSATTSVLVKKDKKQVRKIARKEINKAAKKLTVANAGALDGIDSSGFVKGNSTVFTGGAEPAAGGAAQTVVAVPGMGRVEASCSANAQMITWSYFWSSGRPQLASLEASAEGLAPVVDAGYFLPQTPAPLSVTTNGGGANPGAHRLIASGRDYDSATGRSTTYVLVGLSRPASTDHCSIEGYAVDSG
jgi:hypothetical protein